MKKAILYTRADRSEVADPKDSIAGQEKELQEYCQKNNIEVLDVYRDFGSGSNFSRPEFAKLYLGIVSGKIQADLLLFTTVDRFCLNPMKLVEMHNHLIVLGITPKGIKRVNVCFIKIRIKE